MKKISIALFTFCVALLLYACSDSIELSEENPGNSAKQSKVESESSRVAFTSSQCAASTFDLIAGQTNDVGSVMVANDADNVYVKYTMTSGSLCEVHVWAGADTTAVKFKGGRPTPGQMPYKAENINGSEFVVTIPKSQIGSPACGTSIRIYAHAALCNGETAWGGVAGQGVNIKSSSAWYYAMSYVICCPEEGSTETAFAKGGYVFVTDSKNNPDNLPTLGISKDRWGWAVNLTSEGTTTYNIYAGAGGNNITKGTLVGKLTIEYSNGSATVNYAMDEGYTLEAVHLYAGDLRPTTVAPGQFGNTVEFDPRTSSYTGNYTVSDSNGDGVWIVAHAVVYSTNW